MPLNVQDLLTIPQAAKIAKIHKQTVYLAVWEGKLKVIKLGQRSFIDPKELEKWRESVS